MSASTKSLSVITSKMNLRTVWGVGPEDVWAGGDDGVIVHFDGHAWVVVPSGTTDSITSIYGAAPNEIWATSQKGTVLHWNGLTWSTAYHAEDATLLGVWASGAADVWAVGTAGNGEAGFVYRWDGVKWSPQPVPGSSSLWSIGGCGPKDVWFGGSAESGGGVLLAGDGKKFDLVGYKGASARAIWCVSAGNVWVAPYQGPIQHFDGKAWTDAPATATAAPIFRFAATGPDTALAVGSGGPALQYASGNWTKVPTGTTEILWSAWGDAPNSAWVVGNTGTVLHWNGAAFSH